RSQEERLTTPINCLSPEKIAGQGRCLAATYKGGQRGKRDSGNSSFCNRGFVRVLETPKRPAASAFSWQDRRTAQSGGRYGRQERLAPVGKSRAPGLGGRIPAKRRRRNRPPGTGNRNMADGRDRFCLCQRRPGD